MKIEWQHIEESETQLEQWITDYHGVRLTVMYIPDDAVYTWVCNRTATEWRTGGAYDLEKAMADSLASVQ